VALLDNFTSGDSLDEFAVGFQKVIFGELQPRRPGHGFENLIGDFSSIGGNRKEHDLDEPIRVAVAQAENFLAHLGIDPELFGELAPKTVLDVFSVPHFTAGEFPLQAVSVRAVTLADENLVSLDEDSSSHEDGR